MLKPLILLIKIQQKFIRELWKQWERTLNLYLNRTIELLKSELTHVLITSPDTTLL